MKLIDFTAPPRSVFLHGFLKGFVAPIMLYTKWEGPVFVPAAPVEAPHYYGEKVDVVQADFAMLEQDIDEAISSYDWPALPAQPRPTSSESRASA